MSQPIWPRTGVRGGVVKEGSGGVAGTVEDHGLGELGEV